jgi:hypothetical protein
LGNSRVQKGTPAHADTVTLLQHLLNSPDSAIAISAQWALSRIE